eukprot:GHVN01057118.1.p1 GENE.GHVN01057118.1~~GHVN01057118.1.p1  ORF type:complete len:429 (+),score=70.55 GHVN01057118.1:619-1905(+)
MPEGQIATKATDVESVTPSQPLVPTVTYNCEPGFQWEEGISSNPGPNGFVASVNVSRTTTPTPPPWYLLTQEDSDFDESAPLHFGPRTNTVQHRSPPTSRSILSPNTPLPIRTSPRMAPTLPQKLPFYVPVNYSAASPTTGERSSTFTASPLGEAHKTLRASSKSFDVFQRGTESDCSYGWLVDESGKSIDSSSGCGAVISSDSESGATVVDRRSLLSPRGDQAEGMETHERKRRSAGDVGGRLRHRRSLLRGTEELKARGDCQSPFLVSDCEEIDSWESLGFSWDSSEQDDEQDEAGAFKENEDTGEHSSPASEQQSPDCLVVIEGSEPPSESRDGPEPRIADGGVIDSDSDPDEPISISVAHSGGSACSPRLIPLSCLPDIMWFSNMQQGVSSSFSSTSSSTGRELGVMSVSALEHLVGTIVTTFK